MSVAPTAGAPRGFMPGARIHDVPGLGTFAVFGVADGKGSAGVQVQFAPEGHDRRRAGHMAFKLHLTEGRGYEIRHAGDRVGLASQGAFPDAAVAEAHALADREIRSNDGDVLFNLLSACDAEIESYDRRRADMRRQADAYAFRVQRDRSLDLAEKERLERAALDFERDHGPRADEVRGLRADLREWSGGRDPRSLSDVLAEPRRDVAP